MNRPLVPSLEMRLIVFGVGQELLRIAHLDWLRPAKLPAKRVVGSTVLSATGAAIRVIGKDRQAKDRYVVQREDGALCTLAKATILRRRT
jgi:hypothetical protein